MSTLSINKNEKVRKIFFVLAVLFLGCEPRINFDETISKDGLIYKLDETQPYSGTVLSTHKNGIVSSQFQYVDGEVLGKWKTFDHSGDVVQEGQYLRDEMIDLKLMKIDSTAIYRLGTTHEGQHSFIELILFVEEIDSSNSRIFVKELSGAISKHDYDEKVIILNDDSKKKKRYLVN